MTALRHRATSTWKGLALGLVVSMVVTFAILVIAAKLIQTEIIEEECLGYGVMAAILLGAFGGAATGAVSIQRRKGLICLFSGVLYWGTLLGITALFFGGQYQSVGITGMLIFAGVGAAAFLLTRQKKKENKRNKRGKW